MVGKWQELSVDLRSVDLQGFWPDGIYSAPCDEGLRYDIEAAKSMGLNMLRKHIKVEPDRSAYTSFAFSNSCDPSCCSLDPSPHPPQAPMHDVHSLARLLRSLHSLRIYASFIYPFAHTFIPSFAHLFARPLTHSFTSFIHPVALLARSLAHSFTHPVTRSFAHPLAHSPTH